MSFTPVFLKEVDLNGMKFHIEQEGALGICGMVWSGSIVLSRFLYKNRTNIFKGVKRILEVGTGTGVTGIAVGLMQPDVEVVVTDIADALGLIQTNIMSNACRNVYCEELDWFNPRDLGHFDMVIGSDLVYEPKLFEPLVKTLDLVCKPDTKVFLCNELRSRTNFGFYHKMHEYGWTMSMFPQEFLDPDYASDEIPVFRCYKKSALC